MVTLLFEAANANLFLGFIPESFSLLLFGVVLIVCAVSLRRILNRTEKAKSENFSDESHVTVG